MSSKRSYHDACAMAHALNLVGERWALLVVRELMFGPRRFTDLRAAMPGISANVLTQRLSELEGFGVLVRRRLDPPASAWVYDLTEWGHELEPVVGKLGKWGARSPLLPRDAQLSVNSFILSLRNMFDPSAAEGVKLRADLRVGGQRFHAHVADGRIEADTGTATDPHLSIDGDQNVLASLVYDGRDIDEAVASGAMSYQGERGVLERFLALFSLPQPAEVPAASLEEEPA